MTILVMDDCRHCVDCMDVASEHDGTDIIIFRGLSTRRFMHLNFSK